MFDTRLIRLPDQSHTHAHEHHQLVMSLAGRAEFEVNGCGGEVCRMRACLVPGEAGHVFAGVGDNRMLIIDLGEDNPTPEDPDLLARLFEAPRYPTLDADFQNLLSYAGAELARYGSDPLLTRALGGVLIRALHLRLFGEQQPWRPAGRSTWSAWTRISCGTWRGASRSPNWPRSPVSARAISTRSSRTASA